MNVNVPAGMHVLMMVDDAVGVTVPMRVRLSSNRPAYTPYHVDQPESQQQPARDIPAKRLQPFEFPYADSEGDAHNTQNNGTEHVPQTAKERDDDRPKAS